MAVVLDASALLAYLREEPGAEVVDGLLADARMASVNWAEVMQKLPSAGVDVDGMQEELQALGMRVEPMWPVDGERAGRLRPLTRQHGLSLVDRACLSLGSAAAGLGGSAPALRFIGHDSGDEPLRCAAGGPHLHGLVVGNQQPAQASAIGLIGSHLPAQGGEAAGALVGGAGQFNHQIGAEGPEAAPLLWAEGLPALQAQQGGVGTQYGAIGQAEACAARERNPIARVMDELAELKTDSSVLQRRFTAHRRHPDQPAIGGQLKHRLAVLGTHQFELLRREAQIQGQTKRRQGIKASGRCGVGCTWAGSERHRPRPAVASG
jgi:ribonuclease VapC